MSGKSQNITVLLRLNNRINHVIGAIWNSMCKFVVKQYCSTLYYPQWSNRRKFRTMNAIGWKDGWLRFSAVTGAPTAMTSHHCIWALRTISIICSIDHLRPTNRELNILRLTNLKTNTIKYITPDVEETSADIICIMNIHDEY